jgi:peptidylprolyl isomerase
MGSGRVTLDFNPPLAGKTLVYEVTIQKQLKTAEEKVSALVHRRIPAVEVEKFEFKIVKAEVTINMPAEAFYIEGIQLAKRGISMDIQRFLPELKTIQFVEYFAKPEVGAKAEKEVKKKTAKKSAKKTKDVEKKTIKNSEKKVEKKTAKKSKTKAKVKVKAKDIAQETS